MTFQPSAPHKRSRWLALIGVLTLCVGLTGGNALAASTATSLTDYSQCPNGTNHALACLSTGWINGILNAQNSSYREDQVTPQRTLIVIPKGGTVTGHRIDVTYLTRKGGTTSGNHAYDSLATWNYTETAADRCQFLSICPTDTPFDQFAIQTDSTVVQPSTSPTGVTSDHALSGQSFIFYGPVTGAVAGTPVHTCPITDATHNCASSDDYATIQITFDLDAGVVDTAPANGKVDSDTYVQLVFGGHLASSLTPSTGSQRGWGGSLSGTTCTGCLGASSINGGPYHIRITNIDGGSIGNRDNQISAGAVQPLFTPTLTTTPTASTDYSATIGDSLDVGNTSAGGTATFTLYPSSADCSAGTNAISTQTGVAVVAGVATATDVLIDPGPTSTTTYYWLVSYSGDPAHNLAPADTVCGDETATVNPPSSSTSP